MCCCRAIDAAAALIRSHAKVYSAREPAVSLPLLSCYDHCIRSAAEVAAATAPVLASAEGLICFVMDIAVSFSKFFWSIWLSALY